MGSPKALLVFEGETFLDRLTRVFSEYCSPVVVVVGAGASRIREGAAHPERAVFVENPDYPLGQLSSMQAGLRAVPSGGDGVLFTLVDHPNVQRGTIEALLAHRDALLAIPRHDGRRGHPVYFSDALRSEFLALPPDGSAKTVVNRHAGEIRYLDVNDAGVLSDIDDPAAYERMLRTANL
jgi:molybdenum cofactor cytidylyltransferase